MAIGPGDTFLLTRGTGSTPHLWVILWGPAGAARAFLSVYLTTLRAHSDRSCLIVPGEHPFVQHDTAVAYGEVQRWPEDRLVRLISEGIAKPRQPVSAALLDRMRNGFFRLAADAARDAEHGARRFRGGFLTGSTTPTDWTKRGGGGGG